jgi:hypothetical protein
MGNARGKVTITLTADQWRKVLHAADNGALSGDTELCENMFPHKASRRAFLAAVRTISDAIGADYDTEGYL